MRGKNAKDTINKICPLMSASGATYSMCARERCKWYIPSLGMCAVEVLAYSSLGKALMSIKGDKEREDFVKTLKEV